jgi:hypothetical protein
MLMKLALALKAVEAVAGQAEAMAGEDREDIKLPLHLILLKTHTQYIFIAPKGY